MRGSRGMGIIAPDKKPRRTLRKDAPELVDVYKKGGCACKGKCGCAPKRKVKK